jgi:hypothetical protein
MQNVCYLHEYVKCCGLYVTAISGRSAANSGLMIHFCACVLCEIECGVTFYKVFRSC